MSAAKSASVNVYSSPYCPYCHMAKDFLKERNVKFEDFDVSESQERLREMMKKSGQSGVPVLEINGKIIVGFNREAIIAALGAKK
ncbi:MAG: glutaredoxin domain-containing protein [Candidatus Diapherotrites archaeon]